MSIDILQKLNHTIIDQVHYATLFRKTWMLTLEACYSEKNLLLIRLELAEIRLFLRLTFTWVIRILHVTENVSHSVICLLFCTFILCFHFICQVYDELSSFRHTIEFHDDDECASFNQTLHHWLLELKQYKMRIWIKIRILQINIVALSDHGNLTATTTTVLWYSVFFSL